MTPTTRKYLSEPMIVAGVSTLAVGDGLAMGMFPDAPSRQPLTIRKHNVSILGIGHSAVKSISFYPKKYPIIDPA
jgi:hypothetical protein